MARATALTPQVQQKIVEGIRAGLHIARAADNAGIHEATYRRWMEKGDASREADEPELAKMTRQDLRALAQANDVPHTTKTTRAELTQRLEDAEIGSWARYRAFRAAVEGAEAELEQRLTAQWAMTMQAITRTELDGNGNPIRDANGRPVQIVVRQANYNSIATFLARRFPERWSEKHILELTGADGGPISVTVEDSIIGAVQAYLKGVEESTTEVANTEE